MAKNTVSELQKALADQIIHWLKSEDISVGFHLKETVLAKHFGVSRTPIRAALNYLQEQQIVHSVPYRGFELLLDPADIETPELQSNKQAKPDQLYRQLLLDIFFQELGESFSENDFQQRYQLSRHNGRNLLLQLESDGLLSKGQGYKWQVNQSLNSQQHHYESYRCRLMFEPAALLEPQWQLNRTALETLQQRHLNAIEQAETVTADQLFQLSADFHEQLIACSGNRFLLSMMQQQNRLRKATDLISMHLKSSPKKACQRRLDIINCLLDGDNSTAAAKLTALLENDIRVMQESYREMASLPKEQIRQWLQVP